MVDTINRRAFLRTAASASAFAAGAGTITIAVAASLHDDPFVARMKGYRAELAAYDADPDPSDANPWSLFCKEIDSGTLVIGSAAGALMAMEHLKELDCIIDTVGETMMEAVIAFLKAEA